MVAETRERRLVDTFVTLADTLVAGYDVVDLLQTLVEACADLLDASAAGLMLADDGGNLAVVASTSERSRLVEIMQLRSGHGPCVEAFTTGVVVEVDDLVAQRNRWPEFREEALSQGFRSVHAIPLRLRGSVIGTLNLFRNEPGLLTPEDASVAQGLADVATIGILHERTLRENSVAKEQLQHALDSRVVIEQAKGVIAQTRSVDMDQAFRLLRAYARSNNLNLHDVAARVVARTVSP
ncbi:GAF and ANTAR domain-containing protein [Lacisediminihabitans profunda]|uniref:GAF and ANTAR domain-containing protein n=1 Tax=Lacisediminihabitans profunda TaxID=2594790 RepID=A0A5C8UV24_9MICO|nr:GAF and ANTAR domain-containing protein [Lacisediminihabitans profunda]TXN31862.1 GAF and ANTAR domain-containing protein [Lacisediminihabitans profunda]